MSSLKIGDLIGGGDIIGTAFENDLFGDHRIMVDPRLKGKLVEIMPAAQYNLDQAVAVIEDSEGKQQEIKMSHFWPIRTPRPVLEQLPGTTPLLTGFRVLDSLFPSYHGGSCVVPLSRDRIGRSSLSICLSKNSNCDTFIYVGCSEQNGK